MTTRITVVLNAPDNETDRHDGRCAEWAHQQDVEYGERGVELEWDSGVSTLIPWTSIVRIDTEKCYCQDCRTLDDRNRALDQWSYKKAETDV